MAESIALARVVATVMQPQLMLDWLRSLPDDTVFEMGLFFYLSPLDMYLDAMAGTRRIRVKRELGVPALMVWECSLLARKLGVGPKEEALAGELFASVEVPEWVDRFIRKQAHHRIGISETWPVADVISSVEASVLEVGQA